MEIISCLFYLGIGVVKTEWIKVICGWLFSVLLTYKYYTSNKINALILYICGTACYCISMIWLKDSISYYYSFSSFVSYLFFLLFSMINSMHFFIAAVLINLFKNCKFYPTYLHVPFAFFFANCVTPPLSRENLGTSQFNFSLLSQTADLWGTEGITFLMLLLSSFFWQAYFDKTSRKKFFLLGMSCVTIVCIHFIYLPNQIASQTINIGIVPSLEPQDKILTEQSAKNLLHRFRNLSFDLVTKNPDMDLMIWPESAVLFDIPANTTRISSSEEHYPLPGLHIPILFGAQEKISNDLNKPQYFNSALLISPQGDISGRYRKQHLFPVSEYIPWRDDLTSYFPNLHLGYEFLTGNSEQKPIITQSLSKTFKLAPLLCYDDIVSSSVLTHSDSHEVPQLLVSMSNASWFRFSDALRQHNDLARWRSIEFRQNFIRLSRNGISSGYDSRGNTIFKYTPNNEEAFFIKKFPMETVTPTLYEKVRPYYNLCAWIVILPLVCIIFGSILRMRA